MNKNSDFAQGHNKIEEGTRTALGAYIYEYMYMYILATKALKEGEGVNPS